MNSYEPCRFNQMINGKQMTVVFHVDNMKLPHVDPDVATDILEKLEEVYAKSDPMTIMRGLVHEYLGMTIEYKGGPKNMKNRLDRGGPGSTPEYIYPPFQVWIYMYNYIQKFLNECKKYPEMHGTKTTAAPSYMFNTDEIGKKLDPERNKFFHHAVAEALYLSMRSQFDS